MLHINVVKKQEKKALYTWFPRQSELKIIHRKTGSGHLNQYSITVQKTLAKNKNPVHQMELEIPIPVPQHLPLQKQCQNATICNIPEKNSLFFCRADSAGTAVYFLYLHSWYFAFCKKVLTTSPLYVKIYFKIFMIKYAVSPYPFCCVS